MAAASAAANKEEQRPTKCVQFTTTGPWPTLRGTAFEPPTLRRKGPKPAAFAVPLPVLVVNGRDGVQHRGTLQLPRRAPAAAPVRPSSADILRLSPLMCALGDALAAQEEGLDPERLSSTYAALMSELQEVAGMGVHAVELTPATLAHVLPKGKAQLAKLPEGLRALAGEVRELMMRSTRLAVVPGWVGELTRLEALEVSGDVDSEENSVLKSLPASLGRLGALKQLTLAWLGGLKVLPDAVVRLTSLGSLTIKWCGKLRHCRGESASWWRSRSSRLTC